MSKSANQVSRSVIQIQILETRSRFLNPDSGIQIQILESRSRFWNPDLESANQASRSTFCNMLACQARAASTPAKILFIFSDVSTYLIRRRFLAMISQFSEIILTHRLPFCCARQHLPRPPPAEHHSPSPFTITTTIQNNTSHVFYLQSTIQVKPVFWLWASQALGKTGGRVKVQN